MVATLRSRKGTVGITLAGDDTAMILWQPTTDQATFPLCGDFRRTLQTHIDAIVLRDLDLYALTLGPGDSPCIRHGDGPPIYGREAILEAVQSWFSDPSWAYHPKVLWTFEQERTAMAMLEVGYLDREPNGTTSSRKEMQLLVFQRPYDAWRLVLDQRV